MAIDPTARGLAALAYGAVAGPVTAARMPALTGDVTSSAGTVATAIGAHKVTRGMLAATSGATLLGATAAGDVADLTAAQAKTFLAIANTDVSGLGTVSTLASDTDGTLAANSDSNVATQKAAKAYADAPRHPGYVVGRWYPCAPVVGAAGTALAASTIYLLPFRIDKPIKISDLAARIASGNAAGNAQLAIYAHSAAAGAPTGTAVVSTGNISTGSAGPITAVVTSAQTLQPGTYWMAINQNTSTPVYQTMKTDNGYAGSLMGSATLANVTSSTAILGIGLSIAQTFGTWPDLTSGSFTETTTTLNALLFMKASA